MPDLLANLDRAILALSLASVACGDPTGGSGTITEPSPGSSTASGPTTEAPTTSTTEAPSTSTGQGSTGQVATDATTGTTTDGTTVSTAEGVTDPTAVSTTDGTTGTTTGSTGSTGLDTADTGFVCDPNAVPDTLQFNYVRTLDIGLGNIQASYYNIAAQEMVFLSYAGPGKRVALDGTILGDVEAPAQVTNLLDGATYDQVNEVALLVDQPCNFAEVDPVTLAPLLLTKLDAKFGLAICSGLAVGLDGNLWVTSTNTDEVVVITRDLQTEVARYKVDVLGLTNVDGISLIAGSENFLVLSTYDLRAAIMSPKGELVVPTSVIGGDAAPMVGGDKPVIPDAVLTVCGNGRAWICEGLQQHKTGCYEYAPDGGDSDSCPCVIPG